MYGRPFAISGSVTITPSRIEVASSATSVGVNPSPGGKQRIDTEIRCRTADRVFQSVFNADNAGHLANLSAIRGATFLKLREVLRKQFDLDRLGSVRQIVDHVLQHLDKLHVELRLGSFDLAAGLRNHFINAAAPSTFSFTVMSPVLASVTAARPICRPVRRLVLSTSGIRRRIPSTCARTRFVSLSELPAGMM